ncbi:MAG: 50S ribosomal protein L13 [bacterium]|nr:50S ribosomal protein L13 [bacterium]MBU1917018.1 50S ribosomal protein L13 [bacterium]
MKSFYAKKDQVKKNWHVIDLQDRPVGRVATQIATILRGKDKPTFTPGVDMGDFVIAINAEKIKLTGNKLENKMYYKHTGWMGGLKEYSAKTKLEKDPTFIIKKAVKGMLPRGPLGRKQLKKLKVYVGAEHPHAAQKPQTREV